MSLRFSLPGWWLAVLLFACCRPCLATATDVVNIGNNDYYVLSPAFTYLEDSSGQLGLEDILEPALQLRFKPVPQGGTSTNFGATRAAIWLKVRLQAEQDTPARWMLEVSNPPLDRLDVYTSNAEASYDHQSGGDYLPFDQRSVAHRNHVKYINLLPGSEVTLYLRVASHGTVSVPTRLWQPAALWQSDQKTYSVFSLYFGQLLGLIFYNLMLFLSVRDRAYLLYVLFVACVGFSQVASSGLGAQFVWPQAVWMNDIATNVAYAVSGFFGLLFVRSFLSSPVRMPRLDRALQAGVVLWAAASCLIPCMAHRPAVTLVTVLALASAMAVVCVGVASIRHRHPGAKYFGFAWLALILGMLTLAAHNYGLFPSNPFTANAMLVGSALEMVLLSFALADRINVARREKEVALAHVMSERAMVQALQQSQERYRAVIEHVGEGMLVMQDGRIVFANARATEILGANKQDILDNGLLQHIHPEDRTALQERLRQRQLEQEAQPIPQVRLAASSQGIKWLEFGDSTVPWDGGQGLLVYFLDVTERHNAELETRAAVERQQRLNELRSRFIAMTSHEFRTPLATILSAQDLLQSYNDRLPDGEKLELYDMIRAGVNRMTRMLERILLLGQAEAHMLECKPVRINLATLCRDLVLDAQAQQPASRCVVQAECGPGLEDRPFDETLLRHIFGNLLSNAIKYSPVGGRVLLKVFGQGQHTVFEVSDQGIGIPADELEDLFESFHRASNVGDIQGTGLGLAIVKQAVELHGGTLQVRSTVGLGSCFAVHLPPCLAAPTP